MNEMTLQRFRELADSYGGDFARWPEAARAQAQAMAAQSPEARTVLAEAATLDALLARDATPAPPPHLRRDILLAADARIGRTGFLRALWRELGGLRIAGPAFAASLALGIAVSAALYPVNGETAEPEQPELTELALLGPGYEDYAP